MLAERADEMPRVRPMPIGPTRRRGVCADGRLGHVAAMAPAQALDLKAPSGFAPRHRRRLTQRALGAATSIVRSRSTRPARQQTAQRREQTEIARFGDYSATGGAYSASCARWPRSSWSRIDARPTRLFALTAQAMDDDADRGDVTHATIPQPVYARSRRSATATSVMTAPERDPAWTPPDRRPCIRVSTCAHWRCSQPPVSAVPDRRARIALPVLAHKSSQPNAAAGRVTPVEQPTRRLAQESGARAQSPAAIRYRFSTEAGSAMGRQVG